MFSVISKAHWASLVNLEIWKVLPKYLIWSWFLLAQRYLNITFFSPFFLVVDLQNALRLSYGKKNLLLMPAWNLATCAKGVLIPHLLRVVKDHELDIAVTETVLLCKVVPSWSTEPLGQKHFGGPKWYTFVFGLFLSGCKDIKKKNEVVGDCVVENCCENEILYPPAVLRWQIILAVI